MSFTKYHKKKKYRGRSLFWIVLLLAGCLTAVRSGEIGLPGREKEETKLAEGIFSEYREQFLGDGSQLPSYSGQPYVEINGNQPFFTKEEMTTESFESYSELDSLGRCQTAFACLSQELMPTGERGKIGQIRPTGWQTVKYSDLIEDRYLYNRCHLIAWCLAGENDNVQNLITGTRYMNMEGMLPFEEKTARYLDRTGNHVLYRATPVFEGENLVASGVLLEAYSVEDDGQGICFCVYCFNVQPGIEIDHRTGDSRPSA